MSRCVVAMAEGLTWLTTLSFGKPKNCVLERLTLTFALADGIGVSYFKFARGWGDGFLASIRVSQFVRC